MILSSYLCVFSPVPDGGNVVLGRDSTRTVRWRSIHEGQSSIEDRITTGSDCAFPGLLGSNTCGAESRTAVVLLVDTGSSSSGFLPTSSIEDNINVGLKRKTVITSPRFRVKAFGMKMSKYKEI